MTTRQTDSVLDAIVARKRGDLALELARTPLATVRADAERSPAPPSFVKAIRRAPLGIIAEIKRASPSRGVLSEGIDPAAMARAYADAGADAISILTEEHRFLGSLDDLRAAHAATSVPLLRKDFLFDPYHLYQARAAGASAALLIVAMLEPAALKELVELALEIGITPLVEVHTEAEVGLALDAGARVIGINNRDLHSFAVDLAVTERLAPLVPPDRTLVGESGVFTAGDAARLQAAGVHAILVGESLVRAGLSGAAAKVAELRGAPVP